MVYTISDTQAMHRVIAEAVGYSIRYKQQTVRLARAVEDGGQPVVEEMEVWACTLVAPSGCDVETTLFRASEFATEPVDAAWDRIAPLFMYSLDVANQACDWATQRVALAQGVRKNLYGYRRLGREAMYEGWFGRHVVADELPSKALALALHEAIINGRVVAQGDAAGVGRNPWICQMYIDGMPINDIVARTGLTRQRINQIVRGAGVPVRGK